MIAGLLALDAAIVDAVATLHGPILDAVMLGLSEAGRRGVVWLALATVVAVARPGRVGGLWQLIAALILSGVLVDLVLKPTIGRPRPFAADATVAVVGGRPGSAAFPSGHASTAFAGAIIVSRMWRRGRVLLWALAALIACSRVYLGVHYPLDILGGAALGAALGHFANGGTTWDEPARRSGHPTSPA